MTRGLIRACPACGNRKIFTRWVVMAQDCPGCGLHFERIEGHWIGAVGINTILSFVTLAAVLIAGFVSTFPDFKVVPIAVAGVVVAVGAPTAFFPVSRTLWTGIDIAMRPLEAHEVNWPVVESSLKEDTEGQDTHE